MKDLSESRILIVDDAKTNIDILVEALRGEYKLSVALDGTAALRSVEKSPPDLVLLDIMMPGIDGYEVCRQLRAQESTRELPVMFLSSLEDVKDKTRGFEVGGNDYLTKPFEVLEVKARVRSLLKAKAYADAVREAMARDLRIAREIQMGILPADLQAATSHTDLDVHAIIEPAQQVGGDLYEVLRASDDRLVVALGDVSGKGIPAALFMAVAVTVLRTLARHIVDPAEILCRLNAELTERNPRGMFVTMQCLIFDLAQGCVSCAGAGHHQLAILSPGRPPRLACPSSGRPAGRDLVFRSYDRDGRGRLAVLQPDSGALYTTADRYGEAASGRARRTGGWRRCRLRGDGTQSDRALLAPLDPSSADGRARRPRDLCILLSGAERAARRP